jgi:membrane dipeptidase
MKLLKVVYFVFFISLAFSCKTVKPTQDYVKSANILAQKYIITDGHVDLPYRLKVKNFQLEKEYLDIPIASESGDFDYQRAKKGGLDAPFMSIYIPASYQNPQAQWLADSLINMVNYIAEGKKEYFEVAASPKEVREIVGKGKIALPMGMENGSPIEKLSDIAKYRGKGISYITLTHGKDNQIGDSSYDTTHTWGGLSPYGKEVVLEMANQGIMIDISHVSDSTFYQTVRISPIPVIASHSSARFFTPGFERNMSDEMISILGKNGGVIMVNFGSTFLDGEVAEVRKNLQKEIREILDQKGLKANTPEAEKVIDKYFKDNPKAFSDVEKVADHVDRIVKMAGINHVGIGSDYDGVGDSLPVGLKDVSSYPNLIAELLKRGYSDSDIEKICSGNLFRVWQATLDYSAKK